MKSKGFRSECGLGELRQFLRVHFGCILYLVLSGKGWCHILMTAFELSFNVEVILPAAQPLLHSAASLHGAPLSSKYSMLLLLFLFGFAAASFRSHLLHRFKHSLTDCRRDWFQAANGAFFSGSTSRQGRAGCHSVVPGSCWRVRRSSVGRMRGT